MITIDVTSQLSIEICEVWDFVRDIRSFQAHVVDKKEHKRHIVGKFNTSEVAEQKAREWIDNQ